MNDYTKLVEALRRCAEPGTIIDECDTTDDCPYSIDGYCGDCMNNLVKDAADAIEALQADMKTYGDTAFNEGYEMGFAAGEARAEKRIEPKRGEFEKSLHEMFDSIWDCDINHPIFQDTVGELMEAVLQAYDTVNRAKMEVQDDKA